MAAAFGVSALIAASATAFTVLKVVGAAYLVYVGLSLLRTSRASAETMPAMRAAAPPQGTGPLGGTARSDARGDPSAAGPPQGTGPLGGAARSDARGDPSAAGPPQGTGPLGGTARSDARGDPSAAGPPQGTGPL